MKAENIASISKDDYEGTVAYQLNGLPINLLESEPNKPIPLFRLLGIHNREERKHRAKMYRKHTKLPHSLSDEDVLLRALRSQGRRCATFWHFKDNWSRHPSGIDRPDVYAPSILHSLIAKFYPLAFAARYTEELAEQFRAAGFDLDGIIENLQELLGKEFSIDRLGFITIWQMIVDDLATWELLPRERRTDVANATFALASALSEPEFMDQAALRCQSIMDYFIGMEDGEVAKKVSENQDVGGANGTEPILALPSSSQTRAGEDWMGLVAQLNTLAVRMAQDGPSQSLVDELHELAERFGDVSVPSSVTIEAFLAHLNALFDRFAQEENAAQFLLIMDDLQQILARWELLARQADDANLADFYEDLDRRAGEAAPHEAEYVNTATELAEVIRKCEETQRSWESASFAKKADLRADLKQAEEARDQVDDRLTGTVSALFAALNYQGEAFDAATDWKAKLAEWQTSAHAGETLPVIASMEPQQEQAAPAPSDEAPCHQADVTTSEGSQRAAAADPVHAVMASPEASPTLAPTEPPTSSAPKAVEFTPAIPVVLEEASPPSPAPRQFWSLIEAGEYGLAYNLANVADPALALPRPDALRLLVLGAELRYPQGAIARALEEAVATIDSNRDLATLSGADALAGNLLLVAATVRSGLLAPGTGATEVLQRQVSLGSGWDSLHKLTKLIAESAQQMHGVVLSPDTFRRRAADRTVEVSRKALQDRVIAWLDGQSKGTLSFQAATNVWHQWVSKGGPVFSLLEPMIERGTPMTDKWQVLLTSLADPDEVEAQVQEADRKRRGNRAGNIDYIALDQLQRRVAQAVGMVREWMALRNTIPRTDFADRAIKALDQGLEVLKAYVFAEVREGQQDEAPSVRAAAACLERELTSLYALFDANGAAVTDERAPLLALNGRLLLLPDVHLDSALRPECDNPCLLTALLTFEPNTTTAWTAAVRKMDEEDFDGAERLIAQAHESSEDGKESLATTLEGRLAEARAGLRNLLTDAQRKLEGAFRTGLVSPPVRDAITAELTDVENQLKDVRRVDTCRQRLDHVMKQITESANERLGDIRGRLAELSLEGSDQHGVEVNRLIDRGDALAAEEYLDHLARGEEPPTSDHADEPAAFAPFLASQGARPPNLIEVEAALRKGTEVSGVDVTALSEDARLDAASLLSAWNAVKRAKRPSADPTFDAAAFAGLLSAMGFQVAGGGDVGLNARTATRLDLTVKTLPIADRRLCPMPEFGSDAKGQYRVICVFPKTSELEVTEISLASRGTPTATIVLFMGTLSRDGRQKLLRNCLQARRSWLVVDDVVVLFLALQAQGRLRAMFAATLPYTVTDPYRIKQSGTVPPEMFYGRLSERDAISGHQAAATVYGGRQLGKTAALKEIERQLHNPLANSIVQWVDLPGHGVGRSCRPETLWTIVVRELRRFGIVSMDWPEFKPTEQKHVDRATDDIRAWLDAHPDGRILLLLDEADEFLREDATEDYPVTRQLKALMERTAGRFKAVFVGLHNVLRSTLAPNNPLVHLGAVEIGPLYANGESRAAFEMVRGPFAALGYRFADDSLIMRILAACNYYPNLITHFCRKLLERLRSRDEAAMIDPMKGSRVISEQVVSEVYESSTLRDDIRHYFLLTLQLDTRYELIAYWLAMEYLQKRMTSADGISALDIRAGVRALWPEGFRATTEQEFDALLMEMVGLGVLRRTHADLFTMRNPNVLQLMGTTAEIDERLTKIAVEGELKPGFDASTFRGPMTTATRDAGRSPFTVTQERQIETTENSVVVICGAHFSGLSDVPAVLSNRHNVSNVVTSAGLVLDAALKEFDGMRGKAKPGVNVFVVPDSRPWNADWLEPFREKLGARVSSTSWIRATFLAGPRLLWDLAKNDALDSLGKQELLVLKPWADPYLWVWLEEMNLPPGRGLRKKIMEATDGWPGLLKELHPDLDSGPRLQERIEQFIARLKAPDRAKTILGGLGVANEEVRKGLALMAEIPGEPLSEIEHFWSDMGPADMPLEPFVRCAEMLSLVRQAGPDRWEVEPFVANLLQVAGE